MKIKIALIDHFHSGGPFIYFFHMYMNEPFWSRLKEGIFCILNMSGRLTIIHTREYINRPPLWKRSLWGNNHTTSGGVSWSAVTYFDEFSEWIEKTINELHESTESRWWNVYRVVVLKRCPDFRGKMLSKWKREEFLLSPVKNKFYRQRPVSSVGEHRSADRESWVQTLAWPKTRVMNKINK